ncbi:hypothetical protein [uncultured Pseudomonas sp.]|uniref:hypothetical protein n=1 Tax=uncultured Pseudomonas sp. TaxID=114707 RepID=UPI00258FDACB|nr:hypothetical protein [uncultured Pseudomonas sp.]
MIMSNVSSESRTQPNRERKQSPVLRLVKGGLKGSAWVALILFTTVLLALACSLLIQQFFGDIAGYQHWAETHRSGLQIWRLVVYAALAAGWLPLRQRLRKLPEGAGRLARSEWLAIAVIALYELQLHL